MAELLICIAIALAITVGFGLLIEFAVWLDENKGICIEISVIFIVSFIIITFIVWHVRSGIRENKEAKLERRKI